MILSKIGLIIYYKKFINKYFFQYFIVLFLNQNLVIKNAKNFEFNYYLLNININ